MNHDADKPKTARKYLWRYEVKRSRALVAADELAGYDARSIADARAVAAAFRGIVGDAPREHFVAFYLDAKHRIMGYETIAIGTSSSVMVEPAQVLRGAILAGGVRILVAHNHPSGDATPSDEDVVLTEHIAAAAKLLGIPLLDHVVVGADSHYSFASLGRLTA